MTLLRIYALCFVVGLMWGCTVETRESVGRTLKEVGQAAQDIPTPWTQIGGSILATIGALLAAKKGHAMLTTPPKLRSFSPKNLPEDHLDQLKKKE